MDLYSFDMRPYNLYYYAKNMPVINERLKITLNFFVYGLKSINCQGKNTVCCKNRRLIYYIQDGYFNYISKNPLLLLGKIMLEGCLCIGID